jgi:hypothetical protein
MEKSRVSRSADRPLFLPSFLLHFSHLVIHGFSLRGVVQPARKRTYPFRGNTGDASSDLLLKRLPNGRRGRPQTFAH